VFLRGGENKKGGGGGGKKKTLWCFGGGGKQKKTALLGKKLKNRRRGGKKIRPKQKKPKNKRLEFNWFHKTPRPTQKPPPFTKRGVWGKKKQKNTKKGKKTRNKNKKTKKTKNTTGGGCSHKPKKNGPPRRGMWYQNPPNHPKKTHTGPKGRSEIGLKKTHQGGGF